jgi:hypothetical protein
MFLLALLYGLQAPADDGSCSQWTAADSCTTRKSLFDGA